MKRTPAEEQMEELRRLREGMAKRKATPSPRPATPKNQPSVAPVTGLPSSVLQFELSEPPVKKKTDGPTLSLSKDLYRRLMLRQKEKRSFKRRKDLGDWAAELVLALPFEAHQLSAEAKGELFKRMQEWAKARGLT